jgi:hypothetical protein
MVHIAIRCQPRVPVAADEVEGWLELEVHELRKAAPHGTVRLSRLNQEAPSSDSGGGWLVELELDDHDPLLGGDRLTDALRDMRLLGLEPSMRATPPADGQSSTAVW